MLKIEQDEAVPTYEQLRLLAIIHGTPDLEGSELCRRADCSWAEMFALAELGAVDVGEERLAAKRLHPVLTDRGRQLLLLAFGGFPELRELARSNPAPGTGFLSDEGGVSG